MISFCDGAATRRHDKSNHAPHRPGTSVDVMHGLRARVSRRRPTRIRYPTVGSRTDALVGLAVTAQGWYGKDGWIKSGWLVVVIGLFIVFVFAPSLLLDRTVVNQHGFSKRGGLWGLTVSHDIKFADMRVMRLTTDKVRDRIFSTSTRRYLVCDFKTGES